MSENKTNFWTTLPGILTGVAAFIAAVTGLINAVKPPSESLSAEKREKTESSSSNSRALPLETKTSPISTSGVKFTCETAEYLGKSIPATNVEGSETITILYWKLDNNYFGENWLPEKRCQEVSNRFQRIYDRDGLKYLVATLDTWKPNQEIPVICGVKQIGSSCKEDDLLFTLESKDNPDEVLQDLLNRRQLPSKNPPLLRGENAPKTFAEGKRVYYDISGLFSSPKLRNKPEEKPAF